MVFPAVHRPSTCLRSVLAPPAYRKWLFRGGFAVKCFHSVGPAAAARPWTSLCVRCCDDCFTGRFTLIQDRDGKQVLNECCLFSEVSVHVWSCVALQGLAQFSAVSCCIFLSLFYCLWTKTNQQLRSCNWGTWLVEISRLELSCQIRAL